MFFVLKRLTSSNRARRTVFGLAVMTAGLAAGCSSKPPGCAAPETVQTLRKVIESQTQSKRVHDAKAIESYLSKHVLDVTLITTDGYDPDAKRHVCQATVTVSESKESAAIHYAVRAIEGESSRFLVQTFDDSDPIVWAILRQLSALAADEIIRARKEQGGIPIETNNEENAVRLRELLAEPATKSSEESTTVADRKDVGVGSNTEKEVGASAPGFAALPRGDTNALEGNAQSVARPATPSFNCAADLSQTEQLICTVPALATADAALAAAYSKAVAAAADAGVLKQQQRDWRKARDSCPDAACIQASYAKRIEELSR